MELFESEKEFWLAFKRLQALHGPYGWERKNANKEHEDIYGVRISAGETYFSLQVGASFDALRKVAMPSMEKMLYLFLVQNPRLERLADGAIQREEEEIRRMADGLKAPS